MPHPNPSEDKQSGSLLSVLIQLLKFPFQNKARILIFFALFGEVARGLAQTERNPNKVPLVGENGLLQYPSMINLYIEELSGKANKALTEGDFVSAFQYINDLHKLDPEDIRHIETIIDLVISLGKPNKEILKWCQKYYALNPKDETNLARLFDIYLSRGDTVTAITYGAELEEMEVKTSQGFFGRGQYRLTVADIYKTTEFYKPNIFLYKEGMDDLRKSLELQLDQKIESQLRKHEQVYQQFLKLMPAIDFSNFPVEYNIPLSTSSARIFRNVTENRFAFNTIERFARQGFGLILKSNVQMPGEIGEKLAHQENSSFMLLLKDRSYFIYYIRENNYQLELVRVTNNLLDSEGTYKRSMLSPVFLEENVHAFLMPNGGITNNKNHIEVSDYWFLTSEILEPIGYLLVSVGVILGIKEYFSKRAAKQKQVLDEKAPNPDDVSEEIFWADSSYEEVSPDKVALGDARKSKLEGIPPAKILADFNSACEKFVKTPWTRFGKGISIATDSLQTSFDLEKRWLNKYPGLDKHIQLELKLVTSLWLEKLKQCFFPDERIHFDITQKRIIVKSLAGIEKNTWRDRFEELFLDFMIQIIESSTQYKISKLQNKISEINKQARKYIDEIALDVEEGVVILPESTAELEKKAKKMERSTNEVIVKKARVVLSLCKKIADSATRSALENIMMKNSGSKTEESQDEAIRLTEESENLDKNLDLLRDEIASIKGNFKKIDEAAAELDLAVCKDEHTPSKSIPSDLSAKKPVKKISKKLEVSPEEKAARLAAVKADKEKKKKEAEQKAIAELQKARAKEETAKKVQASVQKAIQADLKKDSRLDVIDDNLNFLGQALEFYHHPESSILSDYCKKDKNLIDQLNENREMIVSNVLLATIMRSMHALREFFRSYPEFRLIKNSQAGSIRNALMHAPWLIQKHLTLLVSGGGEVHRIFKDISIKLRNEGGLITPGSITLGSEIFSESQLKSVIKEEVSSQILVQFIKKQLVSLHVLYQMSHEMMRANSDIDAIMHSPNNVAYQITQHRSENKNKNGNYDVYYTCGILQQAMLSGVFTIGQALRDLNKQDPKEFARIRKAISQFEIFLLKNDPTKNVFMDVRVKAGHSFGEEVTDEDESVLRQEGAYFLYEPMGTLELYHVSRLAGELLKKIELEDSNLQLQSSSGQLLSSVGMFSTPTQSESSKPKAKLNPSAKPFVPGGGMCD